MARVAGRAVTERGLPEFIIIGAQKAGTTSLYAALATHPKIRAASKKEVHFFDYNYHRGLGWYLRHFPAPARRRGGAITGEASPYYLAHPHAARRIHAAVPGVRLIAILRDPVDRALSHYFSHRFHARKHGQVPLTMEEAFDGEEARVMPELGRMLADEGYDSHAFQHFSYKTRGLYAGQLERFFEFFPRDQVLLLRSEDFFARPGEVVSRCHRFLGLEPEAGTADLRPRGQGHYGPDEVPPKIHDDLVRFFAPHNDRFYRLAGSDWGWKRPGENSPPVV